MKRLPTLAIIGALTLTGCGGSTQPAALHSAARPSATPLSDGGPMPPGAELHSLRELRDRVKTVVLATVTGPTEKYLEPAYLVTAGADRTPIRVDRTMWGNLNQVSGGTFDLTRSRYAAEGMTLTPGAQYLMFLTMGGVDGHNDYVVGSLFAVDGDEYVNINPQSTLPKRFDREQADEEIR